MSAVFEHPASALSKTYLLNYPAEAARQIESMNLDDVADTLNGQPVYALLPIWTRLSPSLADQLLRRIDPVLAGQLLTDLDAGLAAAQLARLKEAERLSFLDRLPESIAQELMQLMEYPPETAGKIMECKVTAFHQTTTVGSAINQMRRDALEAVRHLYLLDDESRLAGQIDVQKLALADPDCPLSDIATAQVPSVGGLDPIDDVIATAEKFKSTTLPVLDGNDRIIGVITSSRLMQALKEDLTIEMQTMVGVSKDERALSNSLFACRKRLPWLEINLLTAFLAAAVVGAFEDTIAQFTALAILLPVVAGQSGNAGAQALAVTMRGLTLREISLRHWIQVSAKELGVGLLNGTAIALTCAFGVYVWSGSYGLALIIGTAMVVSMTIAGIAGALVPIALKRFGLDPAQSSSIVLTTVTDIAGFLSFLGIATALSGMLVAG